MNEYALAIDAGGTFFKSAVVAPDGKVAEGSRLSVPVDSNGPKEGIFDAYGKVVSAARRFAEERSITLAGIGISTPGPFDYAAGMSRMTHKFKSIHGVDLRAMLRSRCAIPETLPIKFLHDAHAFVMGEHCGGAAKGFSRVAGITIGTGVGLGCIVDDEILGNRQGGPYLSLFKIPCGDGILEDYVSGRGIVREYLRMSGAAPDGIDAKEVARRAFEAKDKAAIDTYAQAGRRLGEKLVPLVGELKIECVVVGGQVARSFALMEGGLKDSLRECPSIRRTVAAKDIDNAALAGAARHCLRARS